MKIKTILLGRARQTPNSKGSPCKVFAQNKLDGPTRSLDSSQRDIKFKPFILCFCVSIDSANVLSPEFFELILMKNEMNKITFIFLFLKIL